MSRLISVTDAAILVGRDPSSLRSRIRRGDLPLIKEPNRFQGVTRYVREEDVLALTWSKRSPNGTRRRAKSERTRLVSLVPSDAPRRSLAMPALDGPCRDQDVEMFFADDLPTQQAAKRICEGCGVLEACREWGRARELDGVFGGETARERTLWRRANGYKVTGLVNV